MGFEVFAFFGEEGVGEMGVEGEQRMEHSTEGLIRADDECALRKGPGIGFVQEGVCQVPGLERVQGELGFDVVTFK